MNSDTWIHTIQNIVPDYDFFKNLLDEQMKIKLIVKESLYGFGFYVSIQPPFDVISHEFLERCEWAKAQLKNWNYVVEVRDREWHFTNRELAEKFISLYHLRWPT